LKAPAKAARFLSSTEDLDEETTQPPLLVIAQRVLLSDPLAAQASLAVLRASHPVVLFGRVGEGAPGLLNFTDKSVPVYSPDPGFLIHCVEASGGDLSNSILISNDAKDVVMSKAAGLPSIGIGGGETAMLAKAHPDLIIESLDLVPDAIVKLKDSSTY